MRFSALSQGFLTKKFMIKSLESLRLPFKKAEGYGSKISEKVLFSTYRCY
jgi:hypothetical protein